MGLFDDYFDPQQFQASGGLLGRLLSLQQQQGQYQPGGDFGQASTVPEAPALLSTSSPVLPNYEQTSAIPPAPAQDLRSQYAALLRILGDHNAMLATVNPEIGKTLVAQALAGQKKSGNIGGADPFGNGQIGPGNDASSVAGEQLPGVSQVGYFEIPANANQIAGELQSIQQRNEKDAVSGRDYVSGVRDGNIKRNLDKSLDVTNGTVVTLSYNDGRAKTITVTNTDVAHIDPETGEVVIQKSPLGNGI